MENENTTTNLIIIPDESTPLPVKEEPAMLGNLVVYDANGYIIWQSGEQKGGWAERVYPVGVPYLEIPYGAMKYAIQRLVKIDVSSEPHKPVFEAFEIRKTTEEQLAEALEKLKAAGIE